MSNVFYPGQRFIVNGSRYILAQVDSEMFAFISVNDGNRWHDPVRVQNGAMGMDRAHLELLAPDQSIRKVGQKK